MRSSNFCAGLLALTVSAAVAQTGPTFDVASVKPSAPMTGGRMMVRMTGGPGTPDPGQMTYINVSLKNVIMSAYNVKGYQISGPSWLDSERFDIMAKVPQGASKEDFQMMLQNLLAERFKLKLHKDSKELPIFALVVGKNGVKMKETPKEEKPAQDMAGGPGPGPTGPGAGSSFDKPPEIKIGKDGMPQLPRGAMGRGGMIMMGMGGKMKLAGTGQTVAGLCEMLTNQLGRPVVDQTGLTAKYDYELEFAPDETMGRMPGMMPPPPSDGGGPGGGGGGGVGAPESSGPSLITAVQEQLGLKLESKKGPVALLVIDNLEKTPTEN